MRGKTWGADVSQYVSALTESMVMLAEVEAEETAASISRLRFREGEIFAATFRDEVGEASIRAARVVRRMRDAQAAWKDLVAECGEAPVYVSLPLDRNIHRLGAAYGRIEEMEREAAAEVEKDELMRAETARLLGPSGTAE